MNKERVKDITIFSFAVLIVFFIILLVQGVRDTNSRIDKQEEQIKVLTNQTVDFAQATTDLWKTHQITHELESRYNNRIAPF